MKKGKRKHGGKVKADNLDIDNYEVSDSEDGLDNEEKVMLDRAKQGRYIQDESEEEVLKVYESSEESEEEGGGEGLGSEYDSDLEGREERDGLPNRQAWGSSKHRYYYTDYVDQDYGGLGKDEEEAALMEEQEAKLIQKKLMEGLEEDDFTLGLLDKVEEKKLELSKKIESVVEAEKIQTDLSKLSKDEKVQFLKQESPELFLLIEDFKTRMKFLQDKIQPMMDFIERAKLPKCKASDCLQLYYHIILNYCNNITFYLVLKSKRVTVEEHPVVKRLLGFRKLLVELDSVYDMRLSEQVDYILDNQTSFISTCNPEDSHLLQGNRAERRKKKLKILEEEKKLEEDAERKKSRLEKLEEDFSKLKNLQMSDDSEMESDQESDESVERPDKKLRILEEKGNAEGGGESSSDGEDRTKVAVKETDGSGEKRGITYKMAKNKGLTPRKRKEFRNPRVKHRNKYKKAKIRRKGQVKEARKEIEKYGGEISGIKAYLSKSIKIK